MRRLAQCVVAVGALLLLAAVICAAVGIWTVGSDAGRWGGTAFLLVLVGFAAGFGGVLWLDEVQS